MDAATSQPDSSALAGPDQVVFRRIQRDLVGHAARTARLAHQGQDVVGIVGSPGRLEGNERDSSVTGMDVDPAGRRVVAVQIEGAVEIGGLEIGSPGSDRRADHAVRLDGAGAAAWATALPLSAAGVAALLTASPTAFTVLAIVLLAIWALSFVIPSGSYEFDEKTGGPVPGSYEEIPECDEVEKGTRCVNKSLPEQLQQLWTSVPNGLYGIENGRGTATGGVV